jgi:hypothetical protein
MTFFIFISVKTIENASYDVSASDAEHREESCDLDVGSGAGLDAQVRCDDEFPRSHRHQKTDDAAKDLLDQ